ncbi:MAG TPA: sensor domain-containing diguanylate cyclase [Vulgatibacter sp.]|nr:sensor domain-containing diguanylate cyclase [Vulgatibacter sp.]
MDQGGVLVENAAERYSGTRMEGQVDLQELTRTIEELRAFNELGKALTSTLDVGEVIERVMEQVHMLLRPANWSLLLKDDADGSLVFEVAEGLGAEALKGLRLSPTEGIVGWVASRGEPLLVPDVAEDERFAARFDDHTRFTTRSIVAVPMRIRGRTLGVIELVNGADQPPFTGRDLRVLASIADFAAIALENARNFRRVEELTIVDEHTGLYNVRHLHRVLGAEVERARRYGHPVSVIFFDLDRFKEVNDTHGHQAGSAILRECGELLLSTLRVADVAVRYGGDEFVCVLPETSPDQAILCAERLRRLLEERTFLAEEGRAIRLTASFGVACFPDHGKTAKDLLEEADKAMYTAKEANRNTVASA